LLLAAYGVTQDHEDGPRRAKTIMPSKEVAIEIGLRRKVSRIRDSRRIKLRGKLYISESSHNWFAMLRAVTEDRHSHCRSSGAIV
jgi:hypothetical protein